MGSSKLFEKQTCTHSEHLCPWAIRALSEAKFMHRIVVADDTSPTCAHQFHPHIGTCFYFF